MDAGPCKIILFRTGAREVKHLSTNQLWAEGAIKSSCMEVQTVPRSENASDMLGGESELRGSLRRMGATLLRSGWSIRDPDEIRANPCVLRVQWQADIGTEVVSGSLAGFEACLHKWRSYT